MYIRGLGFLKANYQRDQGLMQAIMPLKKELACVTSGCHNNVDYTVLF